MNTHADRHVATSQLDALAAHGEHEAAALAAYRRLIENSADEGVKYLGRLILEDEERHHHVIAEMSNRIASWELGLDLDPATPAITSRVDRQLLDATRQLIALERQDALALADLKRHLRGTPPTSLLPLLVSLMIHDTAKHIEILQFIHDYAG